MTLDPDRVQRELEDVMNEMWVEDSPAIADFVEELMLENLLEEHGEDDPMRDHTQLVARFGRALGADIGDPFDVEPIDESVQWVDKILAVCTREHFVVEVVLNLVGRHLGEGPEPTLEVLIDRELSREHGL